MIDDLEEALAFAEGAELDDGARFAELDELARFGAAATRALFAEAFGVLDDPGVEVLGMVGADALEASREFGIGVPETAAAPEFASRVTELKPTAQIRHAARDRVAPFSLTALLFWPDQ